MRVTLTTPSGFAHDRCVRITSTCIVLALTSCDKPKPQPADGVVVDARIDAPRDAPPDAPRGYCKVSSDCTDPASPVCCEICSPGGACYSSCGVATGPYCVYASCDPTVPACTKADGTPG